MPLSGNVNGGYYNASGECWDVYTEVLGREYSDAVIFGQVHQLTVDAYAVQHAGGPHPDKSVDVHLAGLHLVLERGVKSPEAPRMLQKIASEVTVWTHFEPPVERGALTVFDVAIADSHIDAVREWSRGVWNAWSRHHAAIAELVSQHL